MIELGKDAKPLAVQIGQRGPLIDQAQTDADAITRLKSRDILTALDATKARRRLVQQLWDGLRRERLQARRPRKAADRRGTI